MKLSARHHAAGWTAQNQGRHGPASFSYELKDRAQYTQHLNTGLKSDLSDWNWIQKFLQSNRFVCVLPQFLSHKFVPNQTHATSMAWLIPSA